VITAFDVEFDGYYLQAAYTITGETRPYKKGKFKRVSPKGDMGAVEVVAKYEDGDATFGNQSGEYDVITLGVNWYVNKSVRLSLNYLDADVDTDSADDDGSAVSLRAQYAF